MSIEIKISKKRIPYKMAMLYLNKRVEEVKNGTNRELLWILEHPTLQPKFFETLIISFSTLTPCL